MLVFTLHNVNLEYSAMLVSTVENSADIRQTPPSEIGRDERIRAAVSVALKGSGYRPIAQLEIDVCDGTVMLAGVLPSFYMKQVAQEVVLKLDVASRIENSVRVE